MTKDDYILKSGEKFCSCGKLKALRQKSESSYIWLPTCGDRTHHPRYGIKRPEHSIKMKSLVENGSDAYKDSLMKVGEIFNKDVNTIEFKRKKLIGIGYNVEGLSDSEINLLNSKHESDKLKSRSYRIKTTITRYSIWEETMKSLIRSVTDGCVPDEQYFSCKSDIEVDRIYCLVHGLNTIVNNKKVSEKRSCWYKKEILCNLRMNISKLETVQTKSGMEAKYIRFFETNQIPWDYETIIVMNMDASGFHVPDFIIKYNGETIMLETKGDFFRQEETWYIANKVQAAINYCFENGYRYVMTMKDIPKLNFLETATINVKKEM